ncbi:hypothetical protein JG688_00013898 [Phytophthora aleatoria]|uniref:Uncharacterized protein n=1 Tax=Phytophthora aleatoria TaxID=2496075 RepID=A0A8J5ILD5_9STRA|nr:hypothetical protein JG688_00013898 [Phytophthora aleatoria]
MRRQRGRMDEKEAEWVRGYIKAQRAWKTRTGRSIDEFHISNSFTRRMKKSLSVKGNPSSNSLTREQQEQEQEADASLLVGLTRLQTIFLVAAVVFVCLSLVVQVYVSVTNEQETMVE